MPYQSDGRMHSCRWDATALHAEPVARRHFAGALPVARRPQHSPEMDTRERLPIVPATRSPEEPGQAQFPYASTQHSPGAGVERRRRPSHILGVRHLGRRADSTTAPVCVQSQKLGPEARIKKTVWTGTSGLT
jgi:hypothetical protein